jgi:NAD(P)H-hydrate epimerase
MGDAEIPPLPDRDPRGHKGTFGKVAVFGGCAMAAERDAPRMIGAPVMTALATLRSGAGIAMLGVPEPIVDAALTMAPVCTGIPLPVDHAGEIVASDAATRLARTVADVGALVVGPGLCVSEASRALTLQATLQEEVPVVLDAGALTMLAKTPEAQRDVRATCVLTPHPGEWNRLARAFDLEGDPTDLEARPAAAQRLASFLGVVVVLKGARTVVADAAEAWVHDGEVPAMATGGAGDVLSGVIAALIAGHGSEIGVRACAIHAVIAHAEAALAWCDETGATGGMLATDLLERLPGAVEARRAGLH